MPEWDPAQGREASQYLQRHSFAQQSGSRSSVLRGLEMAKSKEKWGVGILQGVTEVIHLHTPKQ